MNTIQNRTRNSTHGMKALHKGLGVSDFIRFMQHDNKGSGNYVEDRQEWQKQYSVNQLLEEIACNKADQ